MGVAGVSWLEESWGTAVLQWRPRSKKSSKWSYSSYKSWLQLSLCIKYIQNL